MELAYTSSISSNLKTVTINFTIDVDLSEGSIVEILENENIDWIENSATSISFNADRDSEYLLTFFNNTSSEFETSYLLVNTRSLLESNRRNRKDVDNLLKTKKITTHSRVIDCLNRVVIANHRLSRELRTAEILSIIASNSEGDCEC